MTVICDRTKQGSALIIKTFENQEIISAVDVKIQFKTIFSHFIIIIIIITIIII